jgi:hypothetical protein
MKCVGVAKKPPEGGFYAGLSAQRSLGAFKKSICQPFCSSKTQA